jgi:hypothetical protein
MLAAIDEALEFALLNLRGDPTLLRVRGDPIAPGLLTSVGSLREEKKLLDMAGSSFRLSGPQKLGSTTPAERRIVASRLAISCCIFRITLGSVPMRRCWIVGACCESIFVPGVSSISRRCTCSSD